jgi:uncharacterized protein (TIGR03066 family)
MGYYNPYYNSGYGTVYDYSQPIAVDYTSASAAPATSRNSDAMLNDAMAAFRQGDYDAALDIINKAVAQYPSDAVLHEFRALVLFARGDYQQAAATLHSVMAVGPGWDWATLSSLYPDISIYTKQLRALEASARSNPQDAGSRFVLAYHYMCAGHTDAASRQLQQVVQLVPSDRVAADLLRMLTPRSQGSAAPEGTPGPSPRPPIETTAPGPRSAVPPPAATQPASSAKAIDPGAIVGTWHAARDDGSKFELTIRDDGTFTWKFSAPKQKSTEFTGKYTVEGNVLALEREEGGSLLGEVTLAQDGFKFRAVGAPAEDSGLDFGR